MRSERVQIQYGAVWAAGEPRSHPITSMRFKPLNRSKTARQNMNVNNA
jgi:hypothetical protein